MATYDPSLLILVLDALGLEMAMAMSMFSNPLPFIVMILEPLICLCEVVIDHLLLLD